MAKSLLDFGQMANTMVNMGFLQQQTARNDTYERNSLMQQQAHTLDQQKLKESTDARKMNFFLKMSDDPRVKASPGMADQALMQAWKIGGGPDISPDALQQGRDEMRKHIDALANGDRQTAGDALLELQAKLGPDDTKKILDAVKTTGELADHAENLELMRQTQQARFEKIHDAQAKINAGELPYSQGLRDFSTLLQGTDSPDFLRIAKAAAKIPPKDGLHPKTVGAGLAVGFPEVAAFGGPQYEAARDQASQMARTIADHTANAQQTLDLFKQGEPLPKGTTQRDFIERIETGKTLLDSYTKMATWADDPYNLTKLKQAKGTQAIIAKKRLELDNLKTSTAQEVIDIRRQAQGFRESEAGKAHMAVQAQNYGQSVYLDRLALGDSKIDAARRATLASQEKYGQLPDSGKFTDPTQKGKLTIDRSDLTTAMQTETQKHLTGVEGALNIITNLKSAVQQGNIGLAAALKSTAYGFTSQIKGVAEATGMEARAAQHKDFSPSKWFDPSLSTVDLLSNTLAYRIINQEQGGRVSDKDFMEMKKRLNISNLMAGKEDVLQRLTTLEGQMKFEQGVYRKLLPKFGEKVSSSGAGPTTADEYLTSIGLGEP